MEDRKGNKNDFLLHLILNTLTRSIMEEMQKMAQKEGLVADVCFTVNGHELDLESFCKHWQSHVHEAIKEEAAEIAKGRFSDINDLCYDLEERLQKEIDKRLENWEKVAKDTAEKKISFKEFVEDLTKELEGNPSWADKELEFITIDRGGLEFLSVYDSDDGKSVYIDIGTGEDADEWNMSATDAF